MKMKMLLLKNWRDIKTRKAQFIALIVLVAMGITSYVTFGTSSGNLSTSVDKANERLKLADFTTKSVLGAPKSVVGEIKNIDGVKTVQGRLVIDTSLHLSGEEKAHARIIGVPAGSHPKVNDIMVLEGDYLKKGVKNECLVSNKFASDTKKDVGDMLTIGVNGKKKKIEITGIATNPEYFWAIRKKGEILAPGEFAVMFMEQNQVEKLFNLPPSYNDVSILLTKNADRKEVIKKVEKALEPYQVIETVKKEDFPSNFAIHEEVRQNEETGSLMSFLILIISSLALYIALSRMVQSQRGEIGLAKALGYRDWQILLHYLIFSLFIAFVGSIIGFGLGQYFGKWITELYVELLNVPILEHQIYPEVVVGAVMMSSIFCILAGIMPAFSSARMLPARAMHADPNLAVSGGKTPIIERLFGWMLPSSFTFRIPLRNIFRVRRRSVYTIIGICFAMILTVFTWSLFDSMDYLLDTQFNKVDKWDMFAVFSQNFPSKQVEEVKDFDGVKKVQHTLMVPVKLESDGKKHEGPVTAMKPDADFHGFDIAEGDTPEEALKKNGLILPKALADKLDVEVGNQLKVKTPYVKKPFTMKLRAINNEVWGSPIFTSLEQGKKFINSRKVMYNALYLNVHKKEANTIREKLYELPGAYTVQKKETVVKYIESMMGLLLFFGGVMFAFAFIMAFIIIYNTFTANIIERTREIGTMMTIGEDRWHLGVMITLENVLLAVVGIPIGLYLGLQTASAMWQSMSTEAYTLPAKIYPVSFIWIVSSILVILLLSEIPPIRRIFRLDLAEATKAIE